MDSGKLPITGPCPIDLDAIGFDRTSKSAHCTHCSKSVHNLSRMTKDEAREFLREHAGEKLCVSYGRDAAGKIVFKQPEPAPAPVVPLSRLRRRAVPAVAGVGLAAALAACTPVDNPAVDKPTIDAVDVVEPKVPGDPEVVEGKMEVPIEKDIVEVAGEAPIVEMVDGNMPVPKDIDEVDPPQMLEGEIEIPDEPCPDKKVDPKPEPNPEAKPEAVHARGMDTLIEAGK